MMKNKFLTRFLIRAFVLYLAWFFIYESWLKPLGFPDQPLTWNTSNVSANILGMLGYDISVYHKPYMSHLYLGSIKLLGVAHECNALVLFVLFTGFIISFPGKWVNKMWYSVAGIAAIWIVNIFRVVSLTIIRIHFPGALDFNHKYTFTLLVYGFIFGLWMLWVQKFSSLGISTSHKPALQESLNIETEKI